MKQLKIFEGQDLSKNPTMSTQKKARVVSPGGKAGEKSDENSAKELTKLPAPDPTSCPPITAHVSFRNAWMKDITLKALNSMVTVRLKTGERGNKLFQDWESSSFRANFDEWAERYDFKISASIVRDQCTWEQAAARIFNRFDKDMSRIEHALLEVWNMETMKLRTGQDRVDAWSLLRFTHSIACQDPTVLFNLDEAVKDVEGDDGCAREENTFWIKDSWANPTFKVTAHPLSMMWMSSATLLDHPWIWNETDPNVADVYAALQKKKQRVRESKAKQRLEIKKLVESKKARARKRDDISRDEDLVEDEEGRTNAPVAPGSPNKQGVRFQTPEDKELQEQHENRMDETFEDFEDTVQSHEEIPADDGQFSKSQGSETSGQEKTDNDKSNLEDYELETGATSSLFALTGASEDYKSPTNTKTSTFFEPRKQSQNAGTQKVVQLSPLELSRRKQQNLGIKPGNNTNEEIEESVDEEASESEADSDYESPSDDETIDESVEESVDDEAGEDDDDLGELEFQDGATDETNDPRTPDSPPKMSREGAEKFAQMEESKNEEYVDPLRDIQTTGDVIRRNSLGLFDELEAQRMENVTAKSDSMDISDAGNQTSNNAPDDETMVDSNDDVQITKVVNPNSDEEKMDVDSYATVAAKSVKGKIIPEAQKAQNLLQPKIDGLAVPNHHIFSLCFCFMWNGTSAGSTIGKKFISILHAFFTALFQTSFHFKILPLADDRCKNQKHWITNTERTKHLMTHWYQVKNYLDMNYGNLDWLTSQSRSTGLKYVRTRIRFAFDDTIEGAMATIGGILEEDGGWIKDSPLQRGRIAIIGSLPFLPPMMSPEMIAFALMKHFGFLWPIALIWEWVSAPSAAGSAKGKKNQKSPSCQLWRMVTDLECAPFVDKAVRELCNPKINRSKLPWCLITTYFHDWRAASKKWLSVGAYGPVREFASTMVIKAIDFNSVTDTFCSPTALPNILKVVHTSQFGKISLLRLLYSIKATPSQADRAGKEEESEDAGQDTQEGDGNDLKPDKETEGFVDVTNKKGKRMTKDEQLRKAAEAASAKNEFTDAEKRAEMARQKDAEKMDVLGLFQQIGPVGNGFIFFTSRLKVLQLAQNVINGLPEFLVFHLEEATKGKSEEIAAKWVGRAAIIKMKEEGRYWCQDSLCVRRSEAMEVNERRDESGLNWLDWGMDVTDQVRGFLQIDKDSADCKDIDDGATVAGAADELKEATEIIGDLVKEITIKDDKMESLQKEMVVKDNEVALLQQRIAALEAMNADLEVQRQATAQSTAKPSPKTSTDSSLAPKASSSKSTSKKQRQKQKQKSNSGNKSPNPSHVSRIEARRGGGSSAKGQ